MKRLHADAIIPPSTVDSNPYAEDMGILAEVLIDSVRDGILESKNPIELVGNASLAVLLKQYSIGEITGFTAFSFLRSLAITKTQAPVQKIENKTPLDIKTALREVLTENSHALKAVNELAELRRKEVQTRLQTDNVLRLRAIEQKNDHSAEEPEEIRKLREAK